MADRLEQRNSVSKNGQQQCFLTASQQEYYYPLGTGLILLYIICAKYGAEYTQFYV